MKYISFLFVIPFLFLGCGEYYSSYDDPDSYCEDCVASCTTICAVQCKSCYLYGSDRYVCEQRCGPGCRMRSCDTWESSSSCVAFFRDLCSGDN